MSAFARLVAAPCFAWLLGCGADGVPPPTPSASAATGTDTTSVSTASALATTSARVAPGPAAFAGTRVRVTVPEGFTRLPHAAVFIDFEKGVTLGVFDWAIPERLSAEAARKVAEGTLAGVKDGSRLEIERGNLRGLEAIGSTTATLVLYDGAGSHGGVTIVAPGGLDRALVERVFASVDLDRSASIDAFKQLDITFGAMEGWNVAPMTGHGATLLTTDNDPKDGRTSRPVITMTAVLDPDLEKNGLRPVVDAYNLRYGAKLATRPAKIDGLEGLEYSGKGTDKGHDIFIFGVLLRAGNMLVIGIHGSGDLSAEAKFRPQVEKVIRSFRRTTVAK